MCYPLFTRIWVNKIDSPKVCVRVITGIFIEAIHMYQLIITYRVLFYWIKAKTKHSFTQLASWKSNGKFKSDFTKKYSKTTGSIFSVNI